VRKPLVTVAIGVIVIGTTAFVGSRVEVRGVNYHRRNYWTAFYESGSLERLRGKLLALLGRPVTQAAYEERREKRLRAHERQLIKLGYLEERTFDVFGNRPSSVVYRVTRQQDISACQRNTPVRATEASFRLATPQDEIVRITESGPFSVTVVAPKTNMREWEERIRRADRVDTAIK